MSAQQPAPAGGGVGVFTLLTVAAVCLKLAHVITWSWWVVFAPLLLAAWFGLLFAVLFILIKWRGRL